MAIHTSALSLLNAQRKRFANTGRSMGATHELMARTGLEDLKELTSGRLPAKQTAGAFARGVSRATNFAKGGSAVRRLGKRGVPGLPINMQSGRLHALTVLRRVGALAFAVFSSAPYAKYVLHPAGTKFMVARTAGGRPAIGGRQMGFPTPGHLEIRHRARMKVYLDALRKANRS